jgi:hypothetical protein
VFNVFLERAKFVRRELKVERVARRGAVCKAPPAAIDLLQPEIESAV